MNLFGRTTFSAVAALVVVAAVGGICSNVVQTRDLRAAMAVVGQRRAAAEQQIRSAEARRELAQAISGAGATSIAINAPTVASARPGPRQPGQASSRPAMEDIARIIELTRNEPVVVNADLEAHRPMMALRFADFFRQHGIEGGTREKFLENALRGMADERDLLGASTSLGLRFDDPAVQMLARKLDERYLAAQGDLLGEVRLQALKTYEEQALLRNVATGVAGMAVLAGAPMSAAQVRQLADLIVRHVAGPIERRGAAKLDVDWAGMDASARAILTERQHALFTSAEAPGSAGGGARFVLRLNQAIHRAVFAQPDAPAASP